MADTAECNSLYLIVWMIDCFAQKSDHSLSLSMKEPIKVMIVLCFFRDDTKYRVKRILCVNGTDSSIASRSLNVSGPMFYYFTVASLLLH
jgi:hypothetical protein